MTELITKSEFARELGVTPSRVSQMVRDGLPVDTGSGKVCKAEAMEWVSANVHGTGDADPDSLLAARTRAANALAASREFDLGVKRGKFADKAETFAMMRTFRRQTEAALNELAPKYGPALADALGVDTARATAALADVIEALTRDLGRLSPPPSRAALFAVADLWIEGDTDGESDWDDIDIATRPARLRAALQAADEGAE